MTEYKICTYCKTEKEISEFRTRIKYGKQYVVTRCRVYERIVNKIQLDKENKKQTERKRLKDPIRRNKKNEFQREWRKKNIEKNRAYHSKHIKKHVDELSGHYLIRHLTRLWKVKKEDLTPEFLEAYRLKMKINRLIKTKNEHKSTGTENS